MCTGTWDCGCSGTTKLVFNDVYSNSDIFVILFLFTGVNIVMDIRLWCLHYTKSNIAEDTIKVTKMGLWLLSKTKSMYKM